MIHFALWARDKLTTTNHGQYSDLGAVMNGKQKFLPTRPISLRSSFDEKKMSKVCQRYAKKAALEKSEGG